MRAEFGDIIVMKNLGWLVKRRGKKGSDAAGGEDLMASVDSTTVRAHTAGGGSPMFEPLI
ncbi:hypothetical protein ACFXKD_05510 [Nocardiopsis aegyptia]|uniref:hypothetical protein n=1 Tax=Nocardiopsis aegyptia TaxID=220378 RepID=UPI00366A8B75